MGSTPKGKNLLLEEQILSLRVDPCCKGMLNIVAASSKCIPIHLNTVYIRYFSSC